MGEDGAGSATRPSFLLTCNAASVVGLGVGRSTFGDMDVVHEQGSAKAAAVPSTAIWEWLHRLTRDPHLQQQHLARGLEANRW